MATKRIDLDVQRSLSDALRQSLSGTVDTSPEAIAALLDGVTEGPWAADVSDPSDVVVWAETPAKSTDEFVANIGRRVQRVSIAFDIDAANARFIAAARELVPALAAENAALKAEVARLEKIAQDASDPDFLWVAMDNVNDMDISMMDLAEAMSLEIRAAFALKGQTDD